MRTVEQEQVASAELALPPSVQEALGELVNAAKDGLLALSVGVGLGVLAEMMETELDEVVGAKGRRNPDRTAVRHGHEAGEVTLGGRRVGVSRPRARTTDGESEVPLRTYAHFADRDPLTRVVLEQMLAGVSTRRFSRTRESVGEDVLAVERSTSKSAVSREFVGRTREPAAPGDPARPVLLVQRRRRASHRHLRADPARRDRALRGPARLLGQPASRARSRSPRRSASGRRPDARLALVERLREC